MATLQQNAINNPKERTNLLQPNSSRSICSRCRGLLVKTFCISPDEGIAGFQIEVMKCLPCGDLFDNTILENRWRSEHHQLIPQKGGRRS